jgi:hypothetical protein
MLKRAKIDFCKNEKFFNFLQAIDFQRFKTSPRAWAFHTQAKIKIAIHHKNFFRKSPFKFLEKLNIYVIIYDG